MLTSSRCKLQDIEMSKGIAKERTPIYGWESSLLQSLTFSPVFAHIWHILHATLFILMLNTMP